MQRGIGRLPVGRFIEGETDAAGLAGGGLVGHLDREFESIAFPQEPGRVGLDHQVFGGDRFAFEKSGAQLLVVRKPHELPLGEGFRHGELKFDHAVFIRQQLRVEEGRLLEILPGAHLAEVGTGGPGGRFAGRAPLARVRKNLGFLLPGGSRSRHCHIHRVSLLGGGRGRHRAVEPCDHAAPAGKAESPNIGHEIVGEGAIG